MKNIDDLIIGHVHKVVLLGLVAALLSGCGGTTIRKSGQIELFHIDTERTNRLFREHSPFEGDDLPSSSHRPRTNLVADWGDPILFERDTMTIQVHSVYLNEIPDTLTGSKDMVLFAEVWENAAAAASEKPLTSVVYVGKNEMIPGRLNFSGKLAYGPTTFKGHPINIRFTLMVLQKEVGLQQSTAADVVSKYATAIPTYGIFVSQAAAIMRDMLRAQPDVVAFDFERTWLSEQPEKLTSTIQGQGTPVAKAAGSVQPRAPFFNDRFGWLSYGFYALVETSRRTNATIATSPNDPRTSANPNSVGLPTANRFDPDNAYYYDGGWVHVHPGKDLMKIGRSYKTNRLAGNYVVFSITPRQISESSETLRAASEASLSYLEQLRQSEENVKTAIAAINQGADLAAYSVIKARAQSLADRIARKPNQTKEEFQNEFSRRYAELVQEFGPGWNDPNKDQLKSLKNQLLDRYEQIFDTLGKTNLTADAKKALDLSTAAMNLTSLADKSSKLAQDSARSALESVAKLTAVMEPAQGQEAIATNQFRIIADKFAAIGEAIKILEDPMATDEKKKEAKAAGSKALEELKPAVAIIKTNSAEITRLTLAVTNVPAAAVEQATIATGNAATAQLLASNSLASAVEAVKAASELKTIAANELIAAKEPDAANKALAKAKEAAEVVKQADEADKNAKRASQDANNAMKQATEAVSTSAASLVDLTKLQSLGGRVQKLTSDAEKLQQEAEAKLK